MLFFVTLALASSALVAHAHRLPRAADGNIVTEKGRWPGFVDLRMCGGALVHPEWVLTVAHCLHASIPRTVSLGTIDRRVNGVLSSTLAAYRHPDYIPISTLVGKYPYDVGLVHIEPVPLSPNVGILKMADPAFDASQKTGYVVGFGAINEENHNKLRESPALVHNETICYRHLGMAPYGPFNSHLHVCAGLNGSDGGCMGNGGSLLLVREDGEYRVVGLASWDSINEDTGCSEETPAVFAKVSTVRNWIDTVIDG